MREIKFRAWEAQRSKMYWWELEWGNKYGEGSGWLCAVPWGEKRTYHPDNRWTLSPDGVVIMQYTGLKDSRGREIYEGDVVKDAGGRIMQVFWNELTHGWWFQEGDTHIDHINLNGLQVVGNIHEHPELLQHEEAK